MLEGDQTPLPLFERAISRRSLLAGGALLGAALAVPALGCSSSSGDKSAFSTTSTSAAAPTTTAATSGTSGVVGGPLPTGASVTTAFTYAMSGGGPAKNPYIAVWIETKSGTFVDTVSLWYQSGRGDKYLNDMRAWINASGGRDRTMSGATRTPGSYSVVWDGNNASGTRAPEGDYVVCIECAREKGPYQVVTVPITLASSPTQATGADKGELSKISVAYAP